MKKLLSLLFLLAGTAALAQPQNGLDFDGIDDHVEVSAASAAIASQTGFSMACWVLPRNASPAFPNFDGVMGFRNESNADFYILQLSATNFEARLRNSSGGVFTITSPTCQLNTWQHVALVYNGSQLRFYHNGQLSQTLNASGTITNVNVPLMLGRVSFQSTPFMLNGQLDEAALWSRALSDSEVVCIYRQKIDTLMSGLAHYFPMDQGIAGGNNVSQWGLINAMNGNDGFLNNFALTGPGSNFIAATTQITEVFDTICRGSSMQLGNQNFSSPGTYTVRLNAAFGCDSLVRLHLSNDTINTAVTQSRDTLRAVLTTASNYQWLNCNNAFAAIPGAQSAQFVATANGSYAVAITTRGCTDTSACFQVNTVSVNNLSKTSNWQLYPNPTTDWLNIELTEHNNSSIQIYDMQGRLVKQVQPEAEKIRLNISTLSPGIYMVRLEQGGQAQQHRFIKH